MHDALARLHAYPFERLARLTSTVRPAGHKSPLDLSIGEPRHGTPGSIIEAMARELPQMSKYPTTRGTEALRREIAKWVARRFGLPASTVNPDLHVLPVAGTREALFAFAQCIVDRTREAPVVVMPNPFYQIYEGAALLAGASPYFVNNDPNGVPDYRSVPEEIWQRCQLLYVCSPGNPTGCVLSADVYEHLFGLADRYGFTIAADECYSEIYLDEASPPVGLLEIAHRAGRTGFRRCVAFHSLSKRSSVPGLRSGFVAGDADVLKSFLLYRTYHGCALPLYTQAASVAAWSDETHVVENRRLYRQKFDAVVPILQSVLKVQRPSAGFYLWPQLPIAEEEFVRGLLSRENVTVLPGSFLAREAHGSNPGTGRIRIALVPPLAQCIEAAHRIKSYVESLE